MARWFYVDGDESGQSLYLNLDQVAVLEVMVDERGREYGRLVMAGSEQEWRLDPADLESLLERIELERDVEVAHWQTAREKSKRG